MGNDKKMLSIEKIVEMMDSGYLGIRYDAMKACVGRSDIDVDLIEKGLSDEDWEVRVAAYEACVGRTDIDSSLIEKGMLDTYRGVRSAAYELCVGRTDIDSSLIEKGMGDVHVLVRSVAYKALKKLGHPIPLIRTFEPPETVYKKCLNNVIVCATIPKDAQIRGNVGEKCRASAAVITDIVGEFEGEQIGVSWYDETIKYHIGDTIEIDNFDYSNLECSTGFHFFCSLEEVEQY